MRGCKTSRGVFKIPDTFVAFTLVLMLRQTRIYIIPQLNLLWVKKEDRVVPE